MNCIRSLIVSLDLRKFFKVVSDSPPKAVMLVLTWEESFEIVELFCKEKVNQSEISKCPLFISNKIFKIVEFWPDFFKNFNLGRFVIRIEAKSNNSSIELFQNSNYSFDFSFILSVLSKKFFVIRSFDDVFNNSDGFSELEVSVNEIGDVGEIESKLELIFFEPLILVVILYFLKISFGVSEEKSAELTKPSDFPIPESYFGHKICFYSSIKLKN